MPFNLTTNQPLSANRPDPKKAKIEAMKALADKASGKEPIAIVRYVPPGECSDRIRIVFDDSGSMGSYIEDAKKGVTEFLRNCIPNQTAVAVHFMNSGELDLASDLITLAGGVTERHLNMGGTPFFNTLKRALESKPQLTRLVAFTDGSPTDQLQAEEEEAYIQDFYTRKDAWKKSADIIITIAKSIGGEKCIPIDTVFFGDDYNKREIDLLKYLSEQTGGYFLHFNPSKVNFKTAFKYLAPVNRLMLASSSFREDVESGRKN